MKYVLVALMVAAVLGAPAAAADLNGVDGSVSRDGRRLVDEHGRTLAFRGFVLPYKRPPYLVTAAGFGADDADFLANEGFNLLQLRFTYGAIEPQPGVYDEAYIDRVADTVKLLTARGIRVLLQSNQGNFGPKTHGQGFPEWATFTDELPNPNLGFGPNFLGNPALLRAWDNLWANKTTARGEGIQEGYAKGVARVLERVAGDPLVLGLDMINEPWLGSDYPTCFPIGRETRALCPEFDQQKLQPFYERIMPALRRSLPHGVLFYEPAPTFDLGLPTYLSGLDRTDPQVGFTFHAYCSMDGGGADLPPVNAPNKQAQCDKEEGRVFDHAVAHGAAEGVPVLSSEFGGTSLAETVGRLMRAHERYGFSWTYAAYCCRARTENVGGDVILDPSKPPSPENLDQAKLAELVRPYPAALTGTHLHSAFDPASGDYTLRYATGSYPRDLPSIVQVPARQYPNGYDVEVTGARVTSPPGRERLTLLTEPGVKEVQVRLRRRSLPSLARARHARQQQASRCSARAELRLRRKSSMKG